MRVWRSLDEVGGTTGSVVTVGNFDGVHRGHQHVLDLVVARAREAGHISVVVTFDPHPMSIIHPGGAPLALTTLDHRLTLLAQRGVDATLVLSFTPDLARLSPEGFVREVLVDGLHVSEVHVGENFRFGHRASGSIETLRHLGPTYDFDVHPVALVSSGEAVWSSTYVRQCLAEGDVVAAARCLGRLPRVEGPVVEGDKRGRELGYPTANVPTNAMAAAPADGVYAGWLRRCDTGEIFPAAISVGTNPTFDGERERRVESYVLDRTDLELYGVEVEVAFVERLRGMVRFDSIEGLIETMRTDVDRARVLLDD